MKKRLFKLLLGILTVTSTLLVACGDDDSVNGAELSAPEIGTPTDVTQNSFFIDWPFVDGAEAYLIDVATDDEFNDLLTSYDALRNGFSEITVIGLEASTTYFVRVQAVLRDVVSDYSNVVSVNTLSEGGNSGSDTFLKNAADFPVGMAVRSNRLTGQHEQILLDEYDQITSEYEMKMNIMYPSEGNFDFTSADATVDWAIDNGLEVHGHALIWHNATPSWVENFSGTDEEFEDMIEDYVKTVVTRYKGKVKSWDVVNEAFEDNTGALRNSVFRQRMGDDYIEKCYNWVREADSDVLIFYNDYSMVIDAVKRRAAINLMKDFIDRGVPVDGFGFQMHISYDFPGKDLIASTAKEVTDLGLLLHFSELDVRANPNNDLVALTNQRALDQQIKVREVVEVYNAIPEESKFALTIWGMRDDETWLVDFWGHPDWPLLYDSEFNTKKAHTGFLEGLD